MDQRIAKRIELVFIALVLLVLVCGGGYWLVEKLSHVRISQTVQTEFLIGILIGVLAGLVGIAGGSR